MPEPADYLGAIVRIDGQLFEGICISDRATVTFRAIGSGPRLECGQERERTYVIGSPQLSQQVNPVRTIQEEA